MVWPAKSGRDREDTLIPIRVYTNPIGNTSDMRLWSKEGLDIEGLDIFDIEGLIW